MEGLRVEKGKGVIRGLLLSSVLSGHVPEAGSESPPERSASRCMQVPASCFSSYRVLPPSQNDPESMTFSLLCKEEESSVFHVNGGKDRLIFRTAPRKYRNRVTP